MAEEKKGFILYADLINTFNHLSNEDSGKVFKWILDYVNDKNPEPLEGLLAAVCEPIKQQLKRDLTKYESKKGVRSESGKIGNLKRYNLDIYNDYVKGKFNLKEALKLAESRKGVKPVARLADNVNVNVTVKDKVIVKDIKEIKPLLNDFNKSELLNKWISYRKEIKKPLKESSKIVLAKKFESKTEEEIKFIIVLSIENGWQGLFWDKYKSNTQNGPQAIQNKYAHLIEPNEQ